MSPREIQEQGKENLALRTDIDALIEKISSLEDELGHIQIQLNRSQEEKYALEVKQAKMVSDYENRLKEASILNEAIKHRN